jgi:hypothetical protein
MELLLLSLSLSLSLSLEVLTTPTRNLIYEHSDFLQSFKLGATATPTCSANIRFVLTKTSFLVSICLTIKHFNILCFISWQLRITVCCCVKFQHIRQPKSLHILQLVVLQCKIYFRLPAMVYNAMLAELRGTEGGNCKRQPSNLRGDKRRELRGDKWLLRFQLGG